MSVSVVTLITVSTIATLLLSSVSHYSTSGSLRDPSRGRLGVVTLRALLVSAVALAITGCSVTTPVKAPRVTNVEQLPAPEAAPYRMQTGDVLAIKFYNNPELDDEQPVRPDGMISLPFVGQVGAGGRTPGELEQELVDRYTGELASPQVTVIVREYSPQRYYIGGAIADAGTFEIHGPITLAQALQEAGGLLPTARTQQIILIRPDGSGSRAGFAIDMKKVLSGEAPEQMVYLQAQDVVYVPRSRIANVGLFVEQYITNVIPDLPGLGFYLGNRANN